jgi:hypothetical protein
LRIGGDYLQSVSIMKNNDVAVQNAYNDLFDLPKAPPAPTVQIAELDRQIVLDWGAVEADVRATEEFDRKGYTFEGYNVYQVQSAGTFIDLAGDKRNLDSRTDVKLLATYDIAANGVLTVYDDVFDVGLGITIRVVRQRGSESGISRHLVIDRDAIRQVGLVNGQSYYFAVTAYGYNPSDQALTHALESTPRIIRAVPQAPPPGTRYASVNGDTVQGIVHAGPSDGFVEAYVVDPSRVTGHQYRVVFDTLGGEIVWHVEDVTASNQRKLSNQLNQTGDNQYSTVDGILIKVFGAPSDVKDFLTIGDASGTYTAPWYGAFQFNGSGFPSAMYPGAVPGNGLDRPFPNAGGAQWGIHSGAGGLGGDYHYPLFVSRTFRGDNFSRFVPFDWELRFTAAGGRAWLAFTSGAVIDVPFELWRIGVGTPNDPSDDTRVIPWINDANGDGIFNLDRIDHPISGGDNDPETDWIYWYEPTNMAPGSAGYQTEFVARGAAYDGTDGNGNDHHEVIARMVLVNFNGGSVSSPSWPTNMNQQMVETGQTFRIVATKPNQPTWGPGGDAFTFNTASYAKVSSAEAAKADVSLINVFPNPYYGFNRAETSKFTRFVTFNHMPHKAEIRIFNLAGALVRAMVKDDPTQFFNWDLNNSNGLPVASGLYIAYMTLKDASGSDLGTKTLKLVVIQEQQYLDNF